MNYIVSTIFYIPRDKDPFIVRAKHNWWFIPAEGSDKMPFDFSGVKILC